MVDATLENVHFVECSFDDVVMTYLHGGEVVFDHAQFPKLEINGEENNFRGSSNQLVFRDTDLTWPVFTHLETGASLTFINSTVENGNIGHGHIDKIDSKDSHLDMGGREMKVGSVTIQGGYTNIGFGGNVGTISVTDTELNQLDLSETTVATVQVRQCYEPGEGSEAPGIQLGDRRAKMAGHAGQVTISQCGATRLRFENSTADRLTIRDSDPSELLLKGAIVKELDLAHVTAAGQVNTEGAHVEAYRRHDVKRSASTRYSNQGANFDLFGPDTDNAIEDKSAKASAGDQQGRAESSWWDRMFGKRS